MSTPLFNEFKKKASFFLKEKLKIARLALTDVTPAELMTEEATKGNQWAPNTPTLKSISRAAFEIDDYWRIVVILHKRLLKFDKKKWRASYNSLIVLEHLLTHGPLSAADEFQDVISQMIHFHHIDDTGFDWGRIARKKSEWVSKLLAEGTLRTEVRTQARRLSSGIQGFGSLSKGSTLEQGTPIVGQCNSDFNKHENKENQYSCSNRCLDTTVKSLSLGQQGGICKSMDSVEKENYLDGQGNNQMLHKSERISKENMTPNKEEVILWNLKRESSPFLDASQGDFRLETFIAEDDHPFNSTEMHAPSSLLNRNEAI